MNGRKWMELRTCGAGKVFNHLLFEQQFIVPMLVFYVLVKLPVIQVIAI